MSTKIDCWDEIGVGGSSEDGNRIQFMKLPAGRHQVRPLGKPIKFHKFVVQGTDNQWRSAVPMDKDDNPVTQNHNLKPSERYAVNVIDRADGQMKILEAGISVFKEFKKFYNTTKRDPGASRDGADFAIIVQGAGRTKKYETDFVKNTPLTDEETTYVMKERGGLTDLVKIKSYQPVPNDRIVQSLFPEAEVSTPPETPAPAPASPVVESGDGLGTVVEGTAVDGSKIPF